MKLPMLTRPNLPTLFIPSHLQKPKNDRDFSVAGIYTALLCTNISVEMLSGLLLIDISITVSVFNTPIDFFGESVNTVFDIVDDMDINLDAFTDASDNGNIYLEQIYPPI